MKIKTFSMGQNFTNCYIVYDEDSLEGFCVDVCDRLDESYFDFIRSHSLQICYLFLTHGHFDHTLDIQHFQNQLPEVKIAISAADYENILNQTPVFCPPEEFVHPDFLLKEGDSFAFGGDTVQVIQTPGHTSGSVCFLYQNSIFCGDTVFDGSVGRTDLPTGSFHALIGSVRRIAALGEYQLYPGHMGATNIAAQKKYNEYFNV